MPQILHFAFICGLLVRAWLVCNRTQGCGASYIVQVTDLTLAVYILWWFIPSGVRDWWRQPALPHVSSKLTQLRLRVSLVNAIWCLYFRPRNASVLASLNFLVNGQAEFSPLNGDLPSVLKQEVTQRPTHGILLKSWMVEPFFSLHKQLLALWVALRL